MPPERYRCLIVVGDPPGGIGGVNRGRQCIQQLSKPAFALAQGRLGPSAINRHNIFARGRPTKCGNRPIQFTLDKSERLIHFRSIPRTQTGDRRVKKLFNPLAELERHQKVARLAANFQPFDG